MSADVPKPRPGNLRSAPRFEESRVADRRDYLIASHAEIARILCSIESRNCPVAVYFGGEEDFAVSRIVEVDPDGGWLSFAFGLDKHANSRLLAARKLGFVCADNEAKVQFLATGVTETIIGGQPAFRIAFPAEIIRLRRRRTRRHALPPHGPVEILLNFEGIGHVAARIVDMSAGGVGVISYPPDIRLAPGEVIPGCTIRFPLRNATVDLKIMHSSVVVLENGERVRHSGCQFVGERRDLKALIERFIVDLSNA